MTRRPCCEVSSPGGGAIPEIAESTIYKAKAFTEKEALEQHLIDLIAPDDAALMRALEGRELTRFNGSKQTLHTDGALNDRVRRRHCARR